MLVLARQRRGWGVIGCSEGMGRKRDCLNECGGRREDVRSFGKWWMGLARDIAAPGLRDWGFVGLGGRTFQLYPYVLKTVEREIRSYFQVEEEELLLRLARLSAEYHQIGNIQSGRVRGGD